MAIYLTDVVQSAFDCGVRAENERIAAMLKAAQRGSEINQAIGNMLDELITRVLMPGTAYRTDLSGDLD